MNSKLRSSGAGSDGRDTIWNTRAEQAPLPAFSGEKGICFVAELGIRLELKKTAMTTSLGSGDLPLV
ncbi:MAG: hypothetical protein ACXWCH_34450 [Burkholderiales bacterium]